jgi:hypothetical protein
MVRKMWKAASGARKQHCPLLSLVKMLALRRINSLHPSPVPQTWRLVLFIRHLPQITPEELNEMKGPEERGGSNAFLKGREPSTSTPISTLSRG